MLEHAIGAFERREDDEGEPLELRARAREALWRGQASYPMREVAIDEHDVTRAVRDVDEAVRREQPAASSHRLPLTVDELVGAGARDESWERCRGVMVDADLAGALVDHEGGDALVCLVVHARNHLRERGARTSSGGWPARVGPRRTRASIAIEVSFFLQVLCLNFLRLRRA